MLGVVLQSHNNMQHCRYFCSVHQLGKIGNQVLHSCSLDRQVAMLINQLAGEGMLGCWVSCS